MKLKTIEPTIAAHALGYNAFKNFVRVFPFVEANLHLGAVDVVLIVAKVFYCVKISYGNKI